MGHMVLQLIAVTPQPQMFFSTTHMILKIVHEEIELKAEMRKARSVAWFSDSTTGRNG